MVSPAALKTIGAGIGAVSVSATGTGVVVKDQNNKYQKALEEEKVRQEKEAKDKAFQAAKEAIESAESELAKTNLFDAGLYGFLDDQDIVFKVFNANNPSGTLTKDDFKIPGKQANLLIGTKVVISENSSQLKTIESGKVKIEHLKALKGGNDWEWTCKVKFSLIAAVSDTAKELAEKDKLNEFFEALTKDLNQVSDTANKTKWKDIKKKFVKNCSDFKKNTTSQDELKASLPYFTLREKTNNSDGKLYFFKMATLLDAKTWFDVNVLDESDVTVPDPNNGQN